MNARQHHLTNNNHVFLQQPAARRANGRLDPEELAEESLRGITGGLTITVTHHEAWDAAKVGAKSSLGVLNDA